MNTHSRIADNIVLSALFAVLLTTFSMGCGSGEKGTGDDTDTVDNSPTVDEDVATLLAAGLAAENGGATDQLVDIVSLAGSDGLRATHLVADDGGVVGSPTYNPLSGTWHWSFVREYSSANGLYFARVERTYEWRFLKRNGRPQATYIFANDTAYTIELTIVSGAGRHFMPLISQTLDSLAGHLVATGTNTDDISVTGTWFRAALDTVRTRYAVRTIEHATELTITDMRCQRDSTAQPWQSVSGTISGVFSADISFASGDAYAEDTVSREFNIILDSGEAAISAGDTTWVCNLRRAEFQ